MTVHTKANETFVSPPLALAVAVQGCYDHSTREKYRPEGDEQSNMSLSCSVESAGPGTGGHEQESSNAVIPNVRASKAKVSPQRTEDDDGSGTSKTFSLTSEDTASSPVHKKVKQSDSPSGVHSIKKEESLSTTLDDAICDSLMSASAVATTLEDPPSLQDAPQPKTKYQLVFDSDTFTINGGSSISPLTCAYNPPEFEDLLRRKRSLMKKEGNNAIEDSPKGTIIGVPMDEEKNRSGVHGRKRRHSRRREISTASPARRRSSRTTSSKSRASGVERGRSLVSVRDKKADGGKGRISRRGHSVNGLCRPRTDRTTERNRLETNDDTAHQQIDNRPLPRPHHGDEKKDAELQKKLDDATDTIARLKKEVEESLQQQLELQQEMKKCKNLVSDLLRCKEEEAAAPKPKETNLCKTLSDELVSSFQLIHQQEQYIKLLESRGANGSSKDTIPHLRCQIAKLEVNQAYEQFQQHKHRSREAEQHAKTIDHWKRTSEAWKSRYEALWKDKKGTTATPPPPVLTPPPATTQVASSRQEPLVESKVTSKTYSIPYQSPAAQQPRRPIWNEQRTPKGKRIIRAGLSLAFGKQ